MADLFHYALFSVLLFLLIVCNNCAAHTEKDTSTITLTERTGLHPATDFSRHTLVKPRIYHGREKRQISSTKEKTRHMDHIEIAVEIDGEDLLLDLTLNKQLLTDGYFYKYQENGKSKVEKPKAHEIDLCHYNGKVRGKKDSWVALSTCRGLSGVIFDGREMHYIEKDASMNGSLVGDHFLYKHSDIVLNRNKSCGFADHHHGHHDNFNHNRILRYKRSTETEVRGPYNANKESKFVELVLVVDNREYKEMGESMSKVKHHCKTIANIINSLYAPLNIFIALVGVVVWTEHDEISFSSNGDATLTSFLHYRREKLVREHPNDNAQLLTKYNFENGVVGKALKGPICTYEFSGGINTDHSPIVGIVATTVAHEMGHNFGMEHDTNECKCPEERCIMAPSSSATAPTHWSSCSLNYLLLAFTHGMDYCLKNKPKSLFDGPVCGNGFVEPGEQCDCGLPDHCDNTCCNATTCMLHSNATCATGECCDLSTCSPKTAGTLCRSADYECDLPEYCTGQSEYCPADIYKLDTEVCDGGKAYCYHGFCRTRSDQCKLLWGETGKSSDDQCYDMNIKGTRHGNCGYNKLNQSFFKCDNENVLCGMLHCEHLNERLEFGMESVAILSHSFLNKKGTIIPCRTAIVDLGINQIDPGLAPDGARCGPGKMCVNQKCMAVDSLRKVGPSCPKDCSGNGFCNSLGHCHCKDGFAPPFCDYPGPGGSEDSGPASDPNARQGLVAAIYIIFLGIVPAIAIILFLLYYSKRNVLFTWKKSPTATYVINCFEHAKVACNKGVGFTIKRPVGANVVPTVSQQVAQKQSKNIEIHQSGSKSPAKPRTSNFLSENAKHTEDHNSLLQDEPNSPNGAMQNEFFGHFKGFSLTPLKKQEPEPIRSAPPPPKVPAATANPPPPPAKVESTVAPLKPAPPPPTSSGWKIPSLPSINRSSSTANSKTGINKPVQKYNSFKVGSLASAFSQANSTSTAPALPPPNAGSTARPIISSPVLENSTCTAKELLSPLRKAPKAPTRLPSEAPSVEENKENVVSTVEMVENDKEVEFKKPKETALNRITSFLKPADKKPNSNTLPHQKAAKLDKNLLKNVEISNPIPQTQIDIAITALPVDNERTKAVVMRAHSMRNEKTTPRPKIHTFGSMRQPSGYKRPLSIPSGVRPKSPPPPRPPLPLDPAKSEKGSKNQYDDCLNQDKAPLASLSEENSPTSDNIYAVIEESPVSPPSGASNDSMGLLGEIVSEIQNRNTDSIYSTSTLARKQKAKEEQEKLQKNADLYENTASILNSSNTSDDYSYSNMNNAKSSASSTSSGYIHPSAIVSPQKIVKEDNDKKVEEKKPTLSTFKVDKPFNGKTNTTNGKTKESPTSSKKSPTTPTSKTPPKTTSFNRQITPPSLRGRKPSPTRNPKTNRSISNSPDLVTSCSSNPSAKPPDVLNSSTSAKPAITNAKPIVAVPKKTFGNTTASSKPATKSASMIDRKSDKPPIAAKTVGKSNSDLCNNSSSNFKAVRAAAANKSSNVASLQQKFENKNTKVK